MSAKLAIIPRTAPFPEDEIDLLNRVVGPATPVQRAWLAGFLAGATPISDSPPAAAATRPA
jgi:sulfite reductase (NADPH) flavoprotein alpha-component